MRNNSLGKFCPRKKLEQKFWNCWQELGNHCGIKVLELLAQKIWNRWQELGNHCGIKVLEPLAIRGRGLLISAVKGISGVCVCVCLVGCPSALYI